MVLVALDVHENFFVCALTMLFVRNASWNDLDAGNAGFELLQKCEVVLDLQIGISDLSAHRYKLACLFL